VINNEDWGFGDKNEETVKHSLTDSHPNIPPEPPELPLESDQAVNAPVNP